MAVPENWGALSRGHVKVALIRALATGEKSHRKLAAEHGVSPQAVDQFAERNADRIAAVAADLDNEFAGLWIADKRSRLAEYQAQADYIEALLNSDQDEEPADGKGRNRVTVSVAELLRTAQSALRAASEELGQLPGRVSVQITGDVHYAVEGVQLGALQ
jgi:hypothetical protein